jgi:hypothetical protein
MNDVYCKLSKLFRRLEVNIEMDLGRFISRGVMRLSPLGTKVTVWPVVPAPDSS